MTRSFGYLRDEPSKEDRKLGELLGAFAASPPPANADVWNDVCPMRDQTILSCCVGNSWMRAVRLACLRAGIPCPELSPLYSYLLARKQHGGENEDVGTYLRSGGQALKKFGACSEEAWPFIEAKVNVQPSLRALHDGYDRKVLSGYYRIDSGDLDGIRRAIAAGHPVVGGWQITQAFVDWSGKGVIGSQRGAKVGGHAMPITGYWADGKWRLPNSWTRLWGDDGFAVVNDEFISEGDDLWAVAV